VALQIPFPLAGHRTILSFGGALADVHHVRDLSPAQSGTGPGHALRPALPSCECELSA
jgi:hypothetical protein